LGPKRFEVLHELLPKANLIAVLANPTHPNPAVKTDLNDITAAAHEVGQQLSVFFASKEGELEPVFATMSQRGANGLLVMTDPFFSSRREQLVSLAARYAIPAIYEWREYASVGGLMSYGASLKDASRRLGICVGQVLGGSKPADVPVEQSVKIELVLNMKTAKALGVTFPLTLVGRADEVIE
jgi:putative tryptophan/tyrosine transport system substrate-binding protein